MPCIRRVGYVYIYVYKMPPVAALVILSEKLGYDLMLIQVAHGGVKRTFS